MKKLTTLLLATLFCCTVFAQGFYFEMKMTSSKQGPMGTMKVYAQDGNSRSDISITAGPLGQMDIVMLSLKATPALAYNLNVKNKTYTEVDISKSEQYKDNPENEYDITVIGKEKVNGYNSTHVKVKRKDSKFDQDMWLSTEVADYATFVKAKTKFTGHDNLFKALEAKGAPGFPVRVMSSEHGIDMQVDFVKAEKRDNPASLFSLDGYTKAAGASAGANNNAQEMIQKMQNMTPEERNAYLKQLQQQYQQNH